MRMPWRQLANPPGWLQQRLGTGPVTVVGVSFAGSLSLLAACDPRYAPHIRALVLMGAYDDLGRVSRFLATSQAELPDGRKVPYTAHDYGAAVFVYSNLEKFFLEAIWASRTRRCAIGCGSSLRMRRSYSPR